MDYRYFMVLEDGTTFSDLDGCKIVRVKSTPENEHDLDDGVLPTNDVEVVVLFESGDIQDH